MNTRTLAAVLLLPLAVLAQPTPLLSITDPEGDDVGDGSVVYPRDSAYEPGDLDLRSLRVFADGADLRFEASFRNPIRDPASVRGTGAGPEDRSLFARRGFYAFNVDIYLDTDRIAGAGNTVTMPGRHATFDAAHGWEKAIVLTPRPELMRQMFIDALGKAAPAAAAGAEASVDQSVFFPTEIRVRGRTVSFTVPTRFISAQALAGASLTAMVTLAKPSIEADLNLLGKDSKGALERLTLGAAQPEAGRPMLAMGYDGDRPPVTAIVDLLGPNLQQQAVQLAPSGRLTGLNRENQMGLSTPVPAAAPVAAAAPAPAAASGGSWFSRALDSVAGVFGSGRRAAPAAAPAAVPAPSLQSIMAPSAAATPVPLPAAPVPPVVQTAVTPSVAPAAAMPVAPAPAAAAMPARRAAPAAERKTPRDAAYFEEQELRLRTLERLRKNGLISEAEYQQKRKDVLDGL